jgi:Flp pilus assembly protein TadD
VAILLQHRNQLQEAQQLLEQAAKIRPTDPRIHENLGQVYLHTGRAADAVKEFATAVRLAPENPRYHYLRARLAVAVATMRGRSRSLRALRR